MFVAIFTTAPYSLYDSRQNGKLLLTGCRDHSVKLWDVESGEAIRRFTGHGGMVLSVAFSSDGRFAVTASAVHFSEAAIILIRAVVKPESGAQSKGSITKSRLAFGDSDLSAQGPVLGVTYVVTAKTVRDT